MKQATYEFSYNLGKVATYFILIVTIAIIYPIQSIISILERLTNSFKRNGVKRTLALTFSLIIKPERVQHKPLRTLQYQIIK